MVFLTAADIKFARNTLATLCAKVRFVNTPPHLERELLSRLLGGQTSCRRGLVAVQQLPETNLPRLSAARKAAAQFSAACHFSGAPPRIQGNADVQNVSQKPNASGAKLLKHIHAELALIEPMLTSSRAAHACSVFRELLGEVSVPCPP